MQRDDAPGAESSVTMVQVQRSRMRNPPYYSFGGNPGAESCDRDEVRRAWRPSGAESRKRGQRGTRLVVLKGGQSDAYPLLSEEVRVARKEAERGKHSLQGSDSGRV